MVPRELLLAQGERMRDAWGHCPSLHLPPLTHRHGLGALWAPIALGMYISLDTDRVKSLVADLLARLTAPAPDEDLALLRCALWVSTGPGTQWLGDCVMWQRFEGHSKLQIPRK